MVYAAYNNPVLIICTRNRITKAIRPPPKLVYFIHDVMKIAKVLYTKFHMYYCTWYTGKFSKMRHDDTRGNLFSNVLFSKFIFKSNDGLKTDKRNHLNGALQYYYRQ